MKSLIVFLCSALAIMEPIPNVSYVHNVGIYYSDGTIIDEDGEIYAVYGYSIPDNTPVWVTYDTMGTATRFDDEIVNLEVIE